MSRITQQCKRAAAAALTLSRSLHALQYVTGQRCAVLLYHSVADGEGNPYLDSRSFAAHMEMLRAEFRVLHADEYLWHLRTGRRFTPCSVLVTVDDGYANNWLVLQPIMERWQLPWLLFASTAPLAANQGCLWFAGLRAVCHFAPDDLTLTLLGKSWTCGDGLLRRRLFRSMRATVRRSSWDVALPAVTDFIRQHQAWIPEAHARQFLHMLTVEQLQALDASPLVEVGCHTATHPFLTTVREDDLAGEIAAPGQWLAEVLNHPIRTFAYPAGDYGRRELAEVSAAGYEYAFAVVPRLHHEPRYELQRVGIFESETVFCRAKSLGLLHYLRRMGYKRS